MTTAPTTAGQCSGLAERLRVAEVMSAPAPTIDADTPLLEVIHRIIASGGRELVVATGARPEGVITARDILALLETDAGRRRAQRRPWRTPTASSTTSGTT